MAKEQWTYYDPVKAAAEMISIYSPETDRFAITPVQDSKESVTEQVAEASDVLELGKHDNHGSVGGDVDPVKPYPNWSQKNGGSPVKKVQYVDGQQKVFDRPSIERKTVATDIQLPVYHDNHNSVGSDMDPVNSYPNCSQRNEESPARKEPYTDRQRQVFERPSIERVTVATDVQVPSYRDNRGSVSGSTNPVNPYPSWSREDGGTTAKKRPYEDRISKRPSVDMNETDDDSYQFLVSLLPYLRQIPKHRKLTVRHRLQRVLIDEENTIYVAYNNAGASASTGRDNTCYANVPGNNHVPHPTISLVAETSIDHQRTRHHRHRNWPASNATGTVVGPPNVDISATFPYINNYTNHSNVMSVSDKPRPVGKQLTEPHNV